MGHRFSKSAASISFSTFGDNRQSSVKSNKNRDSTRKIVNKSIKASGSAINSSDSNYIPIPTLVSAGPTINLQIEQSSDVGGGKTALQTLQVSDSKASAAVSVSSNSVNSINNINNCPRQIIIKIQLAKMENNGNDNEKSSYPIGNDTQSPSTTPVACVEQQYQTLSDLNANTMSGTSSSGVGPILNVTVNTSGASILATAPSVTTTITTTNTNNMDNIASNSTNSVANDNNRTAGGSYELTTATTATATCAVSNNPTQCIFNGNLTAAFAPPSAVTTKFLFNGTSLESANVNTGDVQLVEHSTTETPEYCEVLEEHAAVALHTTVEMLASNDEHQHTHAETVVASANNCCRRKSKSAATASTLALPKRRCYKCSYREAIRGLRVLMEPSSSSSAAGKSAASRNKSKDRKEHQQRKAVHSSSGSSSSNGAIGLTTGRRLSSPMSSKRLLQQQPAAAHTVQQQQQQQQPRQRQLPTSSIVANARIMQSMSPTNVSVATAATTAPISIAAATTVAAAAAATNQHNGNATTNRVSIWAPNGNGVVGDVIIHIRSPQQGIANSSVVTVAIPPSSSVQQQPGSLVTSRPLQATNAGGPIVHSQIDFVHCLVPDLDRITSSSFYWGKMDRYEAERLLEGKPEGTFLLRDSAQEEFLFSVTFRKYGRSLHARIEQSGHKFSFDCHDPSVFTAGTVTGLLEHYKDPSCVMFFEPMLTIPLHRKSTFTLQELCRASIVSSTTYDGINELELPVSLKSYLKEYHYKQKLRVKPFDEQHHYSRTAS